MTPMVGVYEALAIGAMFGGLVWWVADSVGYVRGYQAGVEAAMDRFASATRGATDVRHH